MANERRGPDQNRKRRFDSTGDGGHENRNHRSNNHRRYEEPSASIIRRLLVSIAEKPKRDSAEEASYVASRLTASMNDDLTKETAIPTILHLVQEQPLKIPFLAAIVLHANDLDPEIAPEVLALTASKLSHNIKMGHWRNVKLILRFLACLQPMIKDEGMIPLLNTLFQRAADLQAESADDTLGVELVKIILMTIPYLIAHAPLSFQSLAGELLEQTGVVASAPPAPFQDLAESYLTEDRPFPFQPILGLLQAQLQKETESGWKLTIIPRPYQIQKQRISKHEDDQGETPKPTQYHLFPTIDIPEKLNPGKLTLSPDCFFSIYAQADIETVPRIDNLTSSLIRDVLVDTINIVEFNRVWVATQLIEMDCYWPANTFAPRGTKVDSLRSVEEGKPTWKTEDLLIDAVFSQIMSLPSPPHKLVFYHSIIREVCQIDRNPAAHSLGRAIRFFYQNLTTMDRELENRFMDWFAHHLSNFKFSWPWREWVDGAALMDVHPHKSFLIGVLDKEVRLGFASQIRETIPIELYDLIPEGKDEDSPKFKFFDSEASYAPEARELLQLIRKKGSDDEIMAVVETIRQKAESDGLEPLSVSTDVYVSCLLVVGSKFLSHMLSTIERHKDFLLSVGRESNLAQLQIITTVIGYWEFRPGTAVCIVDKLLNYTIVTPASVIEWALGEAHLKTGVALSYHWLLEMVASTMSKVTTRVRQIRDAIVQSKVTLAPESEIESSEELFHTERHNMNVLFDTIRDSLNRISSGEAADEHEPSSSPSLEDEEKQAHIIAWATRWARMFERKSTIIGMAVSDAALETAIQVEEFTVAETLALKKADREADERAYRQRREAEVGSGHGSTAGGSTAGGSIVGRDDVKPLMHELDTAAITQDFDPTNGMACDSGPGSANSGAHEN